MELVNKAFKIFKKLQKLDESDFESQVECQSSIFKLNQSKLIIIINI